MAVWWLAIGGGGLAILGLVVWWFCELVVWWVIDLVDWWLGGLVVFRETGAMASSQQSDDARRRRWREVVNRGWKNITDSEYGRGDAGVWGCMEGSQRHLLE